MAYGIFVPQPGVKPLPPALKVWSLNHWPTREALLFFFFILSFMSSLCNLGINPLSDISIENIFSHSVSCPLILLMVFFAVQKL